MVTSGKKMNGHAMSRRTRGRLKIDVNAGTDPDAEPESEDESRRAVKSEVSQSHQPHTPRKPPRTKSSLSQDLSENEWSGSCVEEGWEIISEGSIQACGILGDETAESVSSCGESSTGEDDLVLDAGNSDPVLSELPEFFATVDKPPEEGSPARWELLSSEDTPFFVDFNEVDGSFDEELDLSECQLEEPDEIGQQVLPSRGDSEAAGSETEISEPSTESSSLPFEESGPGQTDVPVPNAEPVRRVGEVALDQTATVMFTSTPPQPRRVENKREAPEMTAMENNDLGFAQETGEEVKEQVESHPSPDETHYFAVPVESGCSLPTREWESFELELKATTKKCDVSGEQKENMPDCGGVDDEVQEDPRAQSDAVTDSPDSVQQTAAQPWSPSSQDWETPRASRRVVPFAMPERAEDPKHRTEPLLTIAQLQYLWKYYKWMLNPMGRSDRPCYASLAENERNHVLYMQDLPPDTGLRLIDLINVYYLTESNVVTVGGEQIPLSTLHRITSCAAYKEERYLSYVIMRAMGQLYALHMPNTFIVGTYTLQYVAHARGTCREMPPTPHESVMEIRHNADRIARGCGWSKCALHDAHRVFAVALVDGPHWTLLHAERATGVVKSYDSARLDDGPRTASRAHAHALIRLLDAAGYYPSDATALWRYVGDCADMPQQETHYDCGTFVLRTLKLEGDVSRAPRTVQDIFLARMSFIYQLLSCDEGGFGTFIRAYIENQHKHYKFSSY